MKSIKRKYVLINIFIIGIVILLYVFTVSPAAVMTFTYSAGYPIYRYSSDNSVSLQCAVSWNAAAVADILDILLADNTKITFLVSGEWALQNPSLLQRIATEGHEVGTMGQNPNQDGKLSFVSKDIAESVRAIERITGVKPRLYYCGARNSTVSAKAAEELGLTTVLCTIDLDCGNGSKEQLVERLRGYVSGGCIVQLTPTTALAEALPQLLACIKNYGLSVVPTGEMLYN